MGATVRLLKVTSVTLALMKPEPPLLAVMVQGLAATPGYSNVRLNVIEDVLSPDGIFDVELVGEAPDGIVLQVITPVSASMVIEQDVEKIVGVMVHARSNTLTELLAPDMGPATVGGLSGGAPLDPSALALIEARQFTTLALGEESTLPFRFSEGTGPLVAEKDFRLEKQPRLKEDFRLEKDPRVEVGKPVGVEDFDPIEGLIRRNPFGSR